MQTNDSHACYIMINMGEKYSDKLTRCPAPRLHKIIKYFESHSSINYKKNYITIISIREFNATLQQNPFHVFLFKKSLYPIPPLHVYIFQDPAKTILLDYIKGKEKTLWLHSPCKVGRTSNDLLLPNIEKYTVPPPHAYLTKSMANYL